MEIFCVSPLLFSLVLKVLYARIYAHKILRALLLVSPTILTIAQEYRAPSHREGKYCWCIKTPAAEASENVGM